VVTELEPGDPPTIGPYRLVGRLGQGGMGQVFLGVSPGGRPVAVKAIRAELAADPQFRTRFGREIAAARKVSGVFTAMVVDADVDGPVAWLATAYVPGPSLAEAVRDYGPLPDRSLLTLAAGLAESLTAIHAAGVVHQDLKPSNVLLAEDGPRVIDFGISCAAESAAQTQTEPVAGSPGFMSPEQALGGQAGPQSDIFSLGAVLVFAATGEGPFGPGTTAAQLYRLVHEAPSLGQVPALVRRLVEGCLAKEPAQRPTAEALLAEVGALQPGGSGLPDTVTVSVAPAAVSRPVFASAGAGPATPGLALSLGGPSGPEEAGTETMSAIAEPVASVPAAGAFTVTSAGLPPPPGGVHDQPPPPGNQPRRRSRRPLVLACVIGAILVVSAFTLTSTSKGAPTAQDGSAAPGFSPVAPSSAGHTTSRKSASPSPSKRVYSPAVVVPAVVPTQSARPSPSPSVSKSASPKPSKSPSPSPSPTRTTRSPSPSPTPTSPSPTPSPSSPLPTPSIKLSFPPGA
jgi:serine/threonine protein kinase